MRGEGRGRSEGRGGGQFQRRSEDRKRKGTEEQTWVRRERQPRDWDAYVARGAEFVYGVAPVLAARRVGNEKLQNDRV